MAIRSKLNCKPHINNITKKAFNIRAFLQRNLSECPRPVKEQAYKTYVRPILEYASAVWDPHTIALTNQLDMVQRRAPRFVTADYRRRHSVTLLLNQLQWNSLLQRRTHSKVTMLYRIHHQLVAIPAGPPYIIYSREARYVVYWLARPFITPPTGVRIPLGPGLTIRCKNLALYIRDCVPVSFG